MAGVVLKVLGTGVIVMTVQMCEDVGEVVGVDVLTIEETCQVGVEEEVIVLVQREFEHGVVEAEAGVAAEAGVIVGVTAEAVAAATAPGVAAAAAAASAAVVVVVVIDIKGGLAKVSSIRWIQIQECQAFRLLLHL